MSAKSEKQPKRLRELSTDEQKAAILWLWKKMRHIFGQTWVEQYGDFGGEASETWREGLSELTGERLKNGVDQARKWENPWPPNLGQFTKLCLTTVKPSYTERRIAAEKAGLIEKKKHLGIPPEVLEVWRAIQKTSTERDASFEADYNKLCRARWGALPKRYS